MFIPLESLCAFLLYLLHTLICSTLRIQFYNRDNYDQTVVDHAGVILALWHGMTWVPFWVMRGQGLAIFTTNDWKGHLLGKFAGWHGYKVVHLNNEFDSREIINMIKIMKSGNNSVVAIDGPEGPARIAKAGVWQLASKSGHQVLPIAVVYRRSWRLGWRWDNYVIPWPGSRVAIVCGKPQNQPIDLAKEIERLEQSIINHGINHNTRNVATANKRGTASPNRNLQ